MQFLCESNSEDKNFQAKLGPRIRTAFYSIQFPNSGNVNVYNDVLGIIILKMALPIFNYIKLTQILKKQWNS